ncbi:glycosyltransferase family 2 protein [Crystallibacter degradans]|uniref:glycosyltransferase family 2 protein n=1 Tax=Crystallibacter degradans TaxID=2726743 RepID=UPI00147443C2|nr:glycosyltransferase family 2 protein [Arthrobacter sp. SF27]NMR28136.1 glycosyltransferase family 2 protein [Arthrobacter sp. SF27]
MTVSVVLVTFNSREIVGEALRDLVSRADLQVIVVDNASTDGTADWLESEFPSVKLLRNKKNVGFAAAVNRGASNAYHDAILLLNPDARLTYRSLQVLTRGLAQDNVGIVAPLLESPGKGLFTANAGHAPTIWRMATHSTGLSRLGNRIPALAGHYVVMPGLTNRDMDVDWVTGGCLLVRREVWTQLNGLTERWFMYAEDIEFCLRAKDRGWGVKFIPSVTGVHAIGGSTSGIDGQVSTLWIRHLFELYVLRTGAGTFRARSWKLVVGAGFYLREVCFRLLMWLRPDRATGYEYHVQRYRRYRIDLFKWIPIPGSVTSLSN